MFERYKVQDGDNLSYISKKFDTNIEFLKNINDIYFLDNLRVGNDIIVPKNKETYYEVKKITKGMKLLEYASKNNINPALLESLNGLEKDDYIYENQNIIIPKNNYSYYITKNGDTLQTVSNTFGITQDRMLAQNETIYLLEGQLIANKKIN